jgi:hypothetical protein
MTWWSLLCWPNRRAPSKQRRPSAIRPVRRSQMARSGASRLLRRREAALQDHFSQVHRAALSGWRAPSVRRRAVSSAGAVRPPTCSDETSVSPPRRRHGCCSGFGDAVAGALPQRVSSHWPSSDWARWLTSSRFLERDELDSSRTIPLTTLSGGSASESATPLAGVLGFFWCGFLHAGRRPDGNPGDEVSDARSEGPAGVDRMAYHLAPATYRRIMLCVCCAAWRYGGCCHESHVCAGLMQSAARSMPWIPKV